jgi:hypothetical protein
MERAAASSAELATRTHKNWFGPQRQTHKADLRGLLLVFVPSFQLVRKQHLC